MLRVIWCVTKGGNTEKMVSEPGVRARRGSARLDAEVKEGNNVRSLCGELSDKTPAEHHIFGPRLSFYDKIISE